ncbi:hypothetical protein LTR10_010134 [Elasticomyces elasticus]|nr:hypothetical protein LTR10_010134 [Elasticomyces elasticus]KAK4972039.1 hypothetical protein LTR42_006544 [Elasticomyces elasticus]
MSSREHIYTPTLSLRSLHSLQTWFGLLKGSSQLVTVQTCSQESVDGCVVLESPDNGRGLWHKDIKDIDEESEWQWLKVILCWEPQQAIKAARDGCLLFKALLGRFTEADIGKVEAFHALILFMRAWVDPLSFDNERCMEVYWASSAELTVDSFSHIKAEEAGQFKKAKSIDNPDTLCQADDGPGLLEDPAAQHVERRALNRDVASAASFRKAHHWIRDVCQVHHKRTCPGTAPSPLPTRLIDVKSCGNAVRLHISSSDDRNYYAALSYCWGGNQSITLRRDNRQVWMSGVPLGDLPQTLQDAVTVARGLDLPYLWIDALCIVQDDPEDVAAEMARMADVYSRAYVTISAASPKSCKEGFLSVREVPHAHRQVFQLPLRCPDDQIGSIRFVEVDMEYDVQNESIHQRAWTLQEAILSPRILVYDSHQLRWVCRSALDSDGWYTQFEKSFERLEEHYGDSSDSLEGWRAIVESYTSRSMSKAEDKLLAISGVALVYANILQDDYLAGLWVSHLVLELLWRKEGRDAGLGSGYQHTLDLKHRPVQYRAPSWSWASVDGTVAWHSFFRKRNVVAQLLDFSVRPVVDTAPFGAVKSGYVSLRGRLTEALWLDGDTIKLANDDALKFLGAVPDAIEDAERVSSDKCALVWCLELAISPPHESASKNQEFAAGLILVPDSGHYKRIGFFCVWSHSSGTSIWRRTLDTCAPQEVTIV